MSKNRNKRRAVTQVPNRRLPRRIDSSLYPDLIMARGATIKQIRRAFQIIPDRIVRPRVYQGINQRPIVRPRPFKTLFQPIIKHKVVVCLKRAIRKEVLFAKSKAGFSGSAPKKYYRKTEDSKVRC